MWQVLGEEACQNLRVQLAILQHSSNQALKDAASKLEASRTRPDSFHACHERSHLHHVSCSHVRSQDSHDDADSVDSGWLDATMQ